MTDIQIEKTTLNKMIELAVLLTTLLGEQSVGHHHLDAGNEIGYKIPRHQYRTRVPGNCLPDIVENLFITLEITAVKIVVHRQLVQCKP